MKDDQKPCLWCALICVAIFIACLAGVVISTSQIFIQLFKGAL